MKNKVSIIIIFDQIRKELFPLLNQIRIQMKNLKEYSFEVVLIHESNKKLKPLSEFKGFKYVNIPEKRGFSFNRNKGLENAKGNIIVFIDDDCLPVDGWLENLLAPLDDKRIEGVMGNVRIPKSNYIGDCISELGFPAGANAGFKNMWKVDKDEFTSHVTTCNCALRKDIFKKVGLFNEKLIYGAEDAELSYRMEKSGYIVEYSPKALAYHKARDNLSSFIKWQLRRGKANYYFRKEVGPIKNFLKLRIWSSSNILKKNLFDHKIFGVFPLLFLSFFFQQIGYYIEKRKQMN